MKKPVLIETDNDKDFDTNFNNWLSEEKEAMASFVLQGHESLSKYGETAVDTLTRLASSLSSVQSAADSACVDLTKLSGNLSGLDLAGYAQSLIDALGSSDAVSNAFGLLDSHYYSGASGAAKGIQYYRPQAEQAVSDLGVQGLTLSNFWDAYGSAMSSPMSADMMSRWYAAAQLVDKLGTYEQQFATSAGTDYYSIASPGLHVDHAEQTGEQIVSNLQSQQQTLESTVSTLQSNLLNLEKQRLSLLQSQASALESTRDQFNGWVQDLIDFRSSLSTGSYSPLSPSDQLAAAKSRFVDTVAKSKTGDTTAYGQLQTDANSYLQLAQGYYASSSDYAVIFEEVNNQLQEVQDYAAGQVDVAQQQLDALQAQISLLTTLTDTSQSMDQILASIDTTQAQLDSAQANLTSVTEALGAAQAQQSADLVSVIQTGDKGITDALKLGLITSTDEGKLVYGLSTQLLGSTPSDSWVSGWYDNVLQLQSMYGQYFNWGNTGVQLNASTLPAVLAEMMTQTGEYASAANNGTAMSVDTSSLDALFKLLMSVPNLGSNSDPDSVSSIFVPHYAGGTDYHPGGLAITSEEGPELLDLPEGTSVTPAGKTSKLLEGMSTKGVEKLLTRMMQHNGRGYDAIVAKLAAVEDELSQVKGKLARAVK